MTDQWAGVATGIRRVLASVSGRAGIVGNPSDIYGGSVVSVSLPRRARVAIDLPAHADPTAPRFVLHCGGVTGLIHTPADLAPLGDATDLLRAVLRGLTHTYGLAEPDAQLIQWMVAHGDIWTLPAPIIISADTTVPYSAGLSGSTALIAAALRAFAGVAHITPTPYLLAEATRELEYTHMTMMCGFQDAYTTAFGGLVATDFRGRLFDQRPVAPPTRYGSLEPLLPHLAQFPPLVVAHTGVSRVSGTVHRPLTQRWLDGEDAVIQGYERVAELGQLGKWAILHADWPALGTLMNENHAIQRGLGGSGPANEQMIAVALEMGAWGAKLAGAGHGGTIIALHPHPALLAEHLRAAGAKDCIVLTHPQHVGHGASIDEMDHHHAIRP